MRKHGGIPAWRDTFLMLLTVSPPSVFGGLVIGSHQSGRAGGKPRPVFKRKNVSCTVTGAMRGGTMGHLCTTQCIYLPTYVPTLFGKDFERIRD